MKWFVTEQASGVAPITVAEYLAVLAFVFAGLWVLKRISLTSIYRKYDKASDKRLSGYGNWVPTIIRITTGLIILLNVWSEYVLAPNIVNNGTQQNIVAISILSFSAILLISGLFVRSAAVILALGYFSAFLSSGFLDTLDHLEYLAVAAYLFFKGPGALRINIKGLTDGKSRVEKHSSLGLPLYLALSGLALVALAYSEKLFNIDLAQSFLAAHPWNFGDVAGLSDRYFIIFIGAMELLIGLSFVFKTAIKLTSLIVLMTMITTAIVLGVDEIIGHLFAVGLVAAIWIPDSN